VWELLALAPEELAYEVARGTHGVDEVAVPSTRALTFIVLATPCFAEVCHGRELTHDRASCVEAPVELRECVLRIFLAVELGVQVTREVI
jgi:hypothetical protein